MFGSCWVWAVEAQHSSHSTALHLGERISFWHLQQVQQILFPSRAYRACHCSYSVGLSWELAPNLIVLWCSYMFRDAKGSTPPIRTFHILAVIASPAMHFSSTCSELVDPDGQSAVCRFPSDYCISKHWEAKRAKEIKRIESYRIW